MIAKLSKSWKMGSSAAALMLILTACQPDTPQSQPVQQSSNAAAPVGTATPTASARSNDDLLRDFAVSNFNGIELNSHDEVKVRQGAAFSVRAKGRQQDLDALDLRVESGRLIIARKTMGAATQKDVDIDITLPTISRVVVRGTGDVDVDALTGDEVSAEIIGAGELKVKSLTATRARLAISGTGDLDVDSGQIDKGEYRITGAGDLDVEKLVANDLTITSSGVGTVKAHASRTAKVNVLGTGDVEIKGGAACQISKQGAGNIRC